MTLWRVRVWSCRDMCLRYAALETSLGEIDRARAVYSHGSEISDPRVSVGCGFTRYHPLPALLASPFLDPPTDLQAVLEDVAEL